MTTLMADTLLVTEMYNSHVFWCTSESTLSGFYHDAGNRGVLHRRVMTALLLAVLLTTVEVLTLLFIFTGVAAKRC